MSSSKIFLYLCFSFVIGIFISSFFVIYFKIIFILLILGVILIVLRKPKIIIFGFCILFLVFGILRHQQVFNKVTNNNINDFYNQEINTAGIIVSEPERRIDKTKFQVKVDNIPGRILITTNLYPEYTYGDEIEINGILKQPVEFEDFNYREYLTKDKIYSVMYYAKINLLNNNKANFLYQNIFNFKNKLVKNIEKVFLPPRSSILKAILLGDKYSISNGLKEKLNITGTRHIVAISGMHMVIMAEIFLFLLLSFGLWRQQAFYISIILLIFYIIMIGAPASAVRAGIMVSLLLFAQQIGRLNNAIRAVIFAATVMLLFNPLLLKIDVGFQLSFMAVLSIIYLKPIFDKLLQKLPNPFCLRDILTLTFAAQFGVLPLLIFHFGNLSLISPLANILIVPFLPFLMIGGLIISFASLIYLPLAKILAWPIWLLLKFIIKIINILSSIPFASFEIKYFSLVFLIIYYIILFIIIKKFNISHE